MKIAATRAGGRFGSWKALPILCALGWNLAQAIAIPNDIKERLLGVHSGGSPNLAEMESGTAVDNSLDPTRYRVGGGDAFAIAIRELPSHDYVGTVNSSGNLYIPDFGEIELGSVTLDSAEEKIRRHVMGHLKKSYRVYVQLKKVKQATVRVTGEVNQPGTYTLPGTHHLLDAIKKAHGDKVPDPRKADLRNVRVSVEGGSETFDVLRMLLGRAASEPAYVYPGMTIEVPALDRTLIVSGEIVGKAKGALPYREGETLASLCSLLTISSRADSQHIQVTLPGKAPFFTTWDQAGSVVLQPDALVAFMAKQESLPPDTVRITGEVLHAGTYSLKKGMDARALIEAAGGPTPEASVKDAILIRRSKLIFNQADIANMDRIGNTVSPYPVVPGHQGARPQIPSSLNDLFVTGDFALTRLDEFEEGLRLESGDEIHVPRPDNWVYVSGHVAKPGSYPYRAGNDGHDYMRAAGGLTRIGDGPNSYVMTFYEGIIRIKSLDQVSPGDYVVVPASTEYKRISAVYIPLVQAVATVISLVISSLTLYYTISK